MSDTDRGNSGISRFLFFFEICRFPKAPASSWGAYCRAVADSREASGKTRTVKAKKMTSTIQLIGCVLFLSLFPLVLSCFAIQNRSTPQAQMHKKNQGGNSWRLVCIRMKLLCFGHSILEIIPCFRETFRIRDTSFCFREGIFPGFPSATFHNTLLRCFGFRDHSAVHFLLAFNRQFQLSTLLQHFRFRKLPRKHTFRKPSASNNTPPPLLINTLLQNSSTTLLQHFSTTLFSKMRSLRLPPKHTSKGQHEVHKLLHMPHKTYPTAPSTTRTLETPQWRGIDDYINDNLRTVVDSCEAFW